MIVNLTKPLILDGVIDFSETIPVSNDPGNPGLPTDIKEIINLEATDADTSSASTGIVDDQGEYT